MSCEKRVKRRNEALDDGSICEDLGRGVLTTLAQTGGAFGFVAEMAGIPGGKAVREAAESAVQHWQDGISAQFKASQNKKFLSDEEGKIFVPGATDPRKIVDLVISNLPLMLVGCGSGLGSTRVRRGSAAASWGGGGLVLSSTSPTPGASDLPARWPSRWIFPSLSISSEYLRKNLLKAQCKQFRAW